MQKIFLGVAVAATVIGAFFATKTLVDIEKNIALASDYARPANLKLIKITAPDCPDCFDIEAAIAALKKQNVSVSEEKALAFDSSEAESLIKQLGIKRLPTYIATGEVGKNNLESFIKNNGEIKNDTFVFTNIIPIFIDSESKREVGRISVTYLVDSACTGCYDPVKIQKPILLQRYGVKLENERSLDIASQEGKRLMAKYKITQVPTILLSPDADQYAGLKNVWKSVGTIESDGWYVFREMKQLGDIKYKNL